MSTKSATAPKQSDEVTQRKREEVIKQLQKQKHCEERAVKIVERLLEDNIAEEFLKDSAQLLTPSHYADVTEERSLVKLCGYPVCSKSLGPVLKQKYHVSTKHNKVYDITDRKRFCSNQCYQASSHFEQQISSSPLFLRNKEQPVQFSLLTLQETSGKAGEEVVTNPLVKLREELILMGLEDREEVLATESVPDTEAAAGTDRSDSKKEKKAAHVLDSDDDDDDDDDGTIDLAGLGQVSEPGKNSGQVSDPGKNSGQVSDPGENTKSAEDKMKTLMEMIDKRDELIAQLKEGKPVPRVLETKVGQVGAGGVRSKTLKHRGETDVSVTSASEESEKKSQGDVTNSGVKVKVVENESGSAPTPAKDPIKSHTSFANRVLENIKTASVQKGHAQTDSVKSDSKGLEQSGASCSTGPRHFTTKYGVGLKNSFEVVRNSLLAWKTDQTWKYLKSIDVVGFKKKMLLQEKVGTICKNLDAEETIENLDKSEVTDDGDSKRKVPGYQILAKEAAEYDLKVKEFFGGHFTYAAEGDRKDEEQTSRAEGDVKEHEITWEPALPLVDSQSQMSIRRKIVLDGINRVLPPLLTTLKLIPREVTTFIKDLVYTFQLSSQNISLKPQEWTLLAIAILKILSQKEKKLLDAFNSKPAAILVENLYASFAFSQEDLDHLTDLMTASDEATLD